MASASASLSCHILDLPEQVLVRVIPKLTDMKKRVLVARAASKLRRAFETWARPLRHTLNLTDIVAMPLPELIEFFKMAGPFMTVLEVDKTAFEREALLVEFITEYCKNLQEIYFSHVKDRFHFGVLLSRLSNLRKVVIDCWNTEDELTIEMGDNTNLETFSQVNGCFSGKYLKGLPNLRELVLRKCYLEECFEFGIFRGLQSLILDDCAGFMTSDPSFYMQVGNFCEQLEELVFSSCISIFPMIAQLPKLQRCVVQTSMNSTELNVEALAERKGNVLTYLKLIGPFDITSHDARCLGRLRSLRELHWAKNDVLDNDHFSHFSELGNLEVFGISCCNRVTDEGLSRLLCGCQQLNCIDILDCEQITNQFVLNALRICSAAQNKRKLQINVDEGRVTRGMLTHEDYLKAQHAVQLIFRQP